MSDNDTARQRGAHAGKHGDLVLNKGSFTVPDEDLKQIRSVLTVVGGAIVHDAGAL